MFQHWMYYQQGQEFGPVPWPELQYLVQAGHLAPTDFVRPQTQPVWLPVANVPELTPARPAAAAPVLAVPAYAGSAPPVLEPPSASAAPVADDPFAGISAPSPLAQRGRMNKQEAFDILPYLVVSAVVALVTCVGGVIGAYMKYGGSVERALQRTAETENRQLPRQIDANTRVDRVVAGPGRRLTYYYTLINLELREGTYDKEDMTRRVKALLLEHVRADPEVESMRRNRVESLVIIRDKTGREVITVTFSPDEL